MAITPSTLEQVSDLAVIGGGVIGLSVAYECAAAGLNVTVIERNAEPGREASWAGAGILSPCAGAMQGWPAARVEAIDALYALSRQRHPELFAELYERTGFDSGYCACGGIELARTAAEASELKSAWDRAGLEYAPVSPAELEQRGIAGPQAAKCTAAFLVPAIGQVRNPWHLQALRQACEQRGVRMVTNAAIDGLALQGDRLIGVKSGDAKFAARQFCFSGGAWINELLAPLAFQLPVVPVRGQMLLLRAAPGLLREVIQLGPRYIVPREDGRLLVGSTEERVGFERGTTPAALDDLFAFARGLVPALQSAEREQSWSGFRPGTPDGLPFLGPLPGIGNAFIAAGHFRNGITLSAGTALVMRDLLLAGDVPPWVAELRFRVGSGVCS